jgi:archaellum component FlaC
MRIYTEGYIEKYARKLIGRTDLEDALKRLDKLTQEEARMAAAENLKTTHTVDNRVKGVADTVISIDNRVAGFDGRLAGVDDRVANVDNRVAGVDDRLAGVDDRVANVDDRVAGVDDRVASINERVVTVDDRVKVVDDKVMEVIDGVSIIFSQYPKQYITLEPLRRATNRQRRRSSQTFVV